MAGVWDLAPAAEQSGNSLWDSAPVMGGTPVPQQRASSILDAIRAGYQNSATGLAIRGKLPEQQLGEEAPWYHRAAAGLTGVATDLPLSVVGAAGGMVAGSAAMPGPGTAIGAAGGAFAAPMALRDALVEAYSHNHASDWNGVWEIAKAAMKGGGKGLVIGGLTGGAGVVAGRVAGSVVAPGVGVTMTAQTATRAIEGSALAAELATMTTANAAIEGHMPTAQDFLDNAILLGGMKAAVHVAGGMRNIYATTGKTPAEIVVDAQRDPALKAQLTEKPNEIPDAYKPLALEQRIRAAIDYDPRPEMIRKNLSNDGKPPKLGEPPIADPVKYEYITDKDTATGVLRAVTDMYQTEITAQTRGVVTNKATAVEALRQIHNGDLAPHVIGEAANAAEIYARAHLLKGATHNAMRELEALAATPEAELTPAAKLQALASLERVSMLKAELEGVGAEAGRSLQIFRAMKRDPSFLGEAENLLALAERKGSLQDIAAMVAKFKDPAQMAEFARRYTEATTIEKVQEGWKAAILSGPQTHLANIFGNVTKWAVEVPESTIAASLFAINKAAKGDPLTIAQWKARAFAPIYGVQHGAREALFVAAEVWRGHGERLEKADVYRTAIEGKKGEIIRLPFKALQVEDALFRTVAERAESYKLAVDRVVKEGVHPDTAEGRAAVIKYTERPELGLSAKDAAKVLEGIQNAGAESVFAQRLGPGMEIAQRAMAGSVMGFVVPFVRTPANLISWAVQHTPAAPVMSGRWRADFAAGGERQSRAIARVIVGTGLAMTAFQLAQDGTLTGGGLFDKEQRGTKAAAGWQPYSVKIGDKYYSYQRIEPVAKVLGLAADLHDLMANTKDGDDAAKVFSMSVLMFGNATISTTYLSGLSQAMQSMIDPDRYGENFMEQYASSVVPKIVGQTAAAMDPHRREVEGTLDAIQSQLPYFREKLLPKRDVWGEPSANSKWFDVLPVATSQISKDKVRLEAERLQIAIADAPRYQQEKGPFNPRDKRTELTPEQRDIFRAVAGQNAMSILGPIVNAADWDRIPDFAKAQIYKTVIEGTRKQGAFAALPPEGEERVKLRQKIVDRIVKEQQAVE